MLIQKNNTINTLGAEPSPLITIITDKKTIADIII